MAEKKKKRAAPRVKMVIVAKVVKVPQGKESQLRKKPGSSNVGKYKKVAKKEFCGAEGKSSKFSYPVNSAKRCRAALAYAHNAPNPAGIKACVKRKCKGEIKKYSKKSK
jgi:hypothetical protein